MDICCGSLQCFSLLSMAALNSEFSVNSLQRERLRVSLMNVIIIDYMLKKPFAFINARLVSVLIPVLLAFYIAVYLNQPDNVYQTSFGTVFETQKYQELMGRMDKENSFILIGKNQDGFGHFVETYLERMQQNQIVKMRNPAVLADLQQQIQVSVIKVNADNNVRENQVTWVINLRDSILTPTLVKYLQLLRRKYFYSRFMVIMNENTTSLREFNRVYFPKPTQAQIKQGILKIHPSTDQVFIDNLLWYYENRIDKIADIVEKNILETFHLREKGIQSQYFKMTETNQKLLRQLCQKGQSKRTQLFDVRDFKLIVGYLEDKYYWSSEEAVLVYSMNSERRCLTPLTFASYDKESHLKQLITDLENVLDVNKESNEKHLTQVLRQKMISNGKKSRISQTPQTITRAINKTPKKEIIIKQPITFNKQSNLSRMIPQNASLNDHKLIRSRIKLARTNEISQAHPKSKYIKKDRDNIIRIKRINN